jgi:hypothetical protein
MTSYMDSALFALALPAPGRLLVGHVSASDRDNQDVRIPAREYGPGDLEADARCRSCPAWSELGRLGPDVLLLIVHCDDCGELAALRGSAA